MTARRGFALLAVLWVIAALSALVGLGLGALRVGAGASANRLELMRGQWAADACLAIAQARWVGHRLSDTATIALGRETSCAWRVEDPTARLNVNTAPREVLAALALERRVIPSVMDSLVLHRPFQDTAQVRAIVGPDGALVGDLTVDGPGTIDLNRASPEIIEALPGLRAEAAEQLAEHRRLGRPVTGLDQLVSALPGSRPALLAHYADLSALVTFAPPQFLITATGWVGGGGTALHATIEELVVPLPDRLAVIRRRLW